MLKTLVKCFMLSVVYTLNALMDTFSPLYDPRQTSEYPPEAKGTSLSFLICLSSK